MKQRHGSKFSSLVINIVRVSMPLWWISLSVFLLWILLSVFLWWISLSCFSASDEYHFRSFSAFLMNTIFCTFFSASLFLSSQWSVVFQDTPEYFNTVCLSRPSQVYRQEVQILRGFRWAARGTDVPAADPLSRDRELSRQQVSRQQTGCWRQTSGGWPQSERRVSKVKFRNL